MCFRPGDPEYGKVLTIGKLRDMIAYLPKDMPVRISADMTSQFAEIEHTEEDIIGYSGKGTIGVFIIGASDE